MDEKTKRSCIDCAGGPCSKGEGYPEFCQTTSLDPELLSQAMHCYRERDNRRIAIASAEVECEGYCQWTRVEEIMEFARKIGARKIGIATCVGLIREARTFAKILRARSFEVYGVACKCGAQLKTSIGIDEKCAQVGKNMCNPILQAKLLEREETQLNVAIGLCVGHDSLFYKYSHTVTTTLVTKDRVLGHNPAAALYTADSYYRRKLFESKE
jgi:uncharacterized metal-binding protein